MLITYPINFSLLNFACVFFTNLTHHLLSNIPNIKSAISIQSLLKSALLNRLGIFAILLAIISNATALAHTAPIHISSTLSATLNKGEYILNINFTMTDEWQLYGPIQPNSLGKPLHINLANSINIEKWQIDWPEAEEYTYKLPDIDLTSNVYKSMVSVPIKVNIANINEPATLDAQISYGICKEACSEGSAHLQKIIVPADGFYGYYAKMMILAILAGVVLNFMPCVLPVLMLKLLGIVRYSSYPKKLIRLHLGVSFGGVLAFFLLLGILTAALQAGQQHLEWGQHFSSPTLLMLICLFLMLLISELRGELPLAMPTYLQNLANPQHSTSAYFSSFSAGALSAVLASSCTAPFLAATIAFAFTQPWYIIIMLYLCIGFGMAMPYAFVLIWPQRLSWLAKLQYYLPKIINIIIILLILTIVWLLSLIINLLTLQASTTFIGCLIIIRAILSHKVIEQKSFYTQIIVLLFIVGIPPLLSLSMDRLTKLEITALPTEINIKNKIIQLQQSGKTVLVYVSANWCLTCKANEIMVLERADVVKWLKKHNVAIIKLDYTTRTPAITQFLQQHHHYGIPFTIVYRPNTKEGITLPSLLLSDKVLKEAVNSPDH